MEDQEEYKTEGPEQDDPNLKEPEEEVRRCLACGQPHKGWKPKEEGEVPPSILIIKFAGPGSAQIMMMRREGVVTTEQFGAAGLFLQTRAQQEWTLPVMQMVAENIIAEFMERVSKPKIANPGDMPPFFTLNRERGPVRVHISTDALNANGC